MIIVIFLVLYKNYTCAYTIQLFLIAFIFTYTLDEKEQPDLDYDGVRGYFEEGGAWPAASPPSFFFKKKFNLKEKL